MQTRVLLCHLFFLFLSLACDGGGTGPGKDEVASVAVSPPSATIDIGATFQLSAQVKNASGDLLTTAVTWSSSDASVATCSASGLVTGVSEGTATITARSGEVSGSATVSVFDSSLPDSPSDLLATSLSTTTIEISWTDNSGNEDEFRISREKVVEGSSGTSEGPSRVFSSVGTVGPDITTFLDTGLETDTTYRYRVQACNHNGCSDPFAAQVDASTLAYLVLEPTSFPSKPVGVAFEKALQATGGDGTYTWLVTSGSLPVGLELHPGSGEISGTPTSTGISEFTLQVQSGDGQTASGDFTLVITIDCAAQSEIPESECKALVTLFDSTNGLGWDLSSGWLVTPTPCSWARVGCHEGSVIWIELLGNDLKGTLPAEIGNLTSLHGLDLSNNQLTGPIPAELGNLSELSFLDLTENQLSGPVPLEVAQNGGRIEAEEGRYSCYLGPWGNEELYIPASLEYWEADLDRNGVICGLDYLQDPVGTITWPSPGSKSWSTVPNPLEIKLFYNGYYNDPPCQNAQTTLEVVEVGWNQPARHRFDETDPSFSGFVHCLTDGQDQTIAFGFIQFTSWGVNESHMLDEGAPDLVGHTIKFIDLIVDGISVTGTEGAYLVDIQMRLEFLGW